MSQPKSTSKPKSKTTKQRRPPSKASTKPTTKPKPQAEPKPSASQTKLPPLPAVAETVINRHWFGLAVLYFFTILGILFVIILTFVQDAVAINPGVITAVLFIVACSVGLIFVAMYSIYTSNKLIINKYEVRQITRSALFASKFSVLNLIDIEDVTVIRQGFFSHILDYGTLTIETAGEQKNFVFTYCPRPEECIKALLSSRRTMVDRNRVVFD